DHRPGCSDSGTPVTGSKQTNKPRMGGRPQAKVKRQRNPGTGRHPSVPPMLMTRFHPVRPDG
ncbi:MAG: hypothetical protein IJ160_10525, partial [Muribaculaceae bacterium]|nr:hypothetical protein [Muribaculaceae bacterium]